MDGSSATRIGRPREAAFSATRRLRFSGTVLDEFLDRLQAAATNSARTVIVWSDQRVRTLSRHGKTSIMPRPSPAQATTFPPAIRTAVPAAQRLGRVATATFLLMLPVTLIVPGLKETVADRYRASVFWTHVFMSVNLIAAVLAAPLIAFACDRVRSRAGLAAAALVFQAGLFLWMAATPHLTVLLFLRGVEGAMHATALASLMALAAEGAAPERRGRTMGLIGACMMFGTATGTRLGGLVSSSGAEYVFPAAAVASLMAAVFAAVCPGSLVHSPAGRQTLAGLATLLRERSGLLGVYAYAFVDRFCVGVIVSTFVLFLAGVHDLSADARSRLLALFMVPFALLVYPAGRLVDRVGSVWPLTAGSAAFGLIFGSYGFVPAAWLWGLMVISGVVSALMFAPTLSLCAEQTPPGQRGAAFAGFNAAGSIGFLSGPLAGGAVVAALTPGWGAWGAYCAAFVVAGASQLLCVAVTLPWLVRVEREKRGASAARRYGNRE
jgi:MFS family permease